MKLNNMRLRNFKAKKDFLLNIDGKSCRVYGQNEAGKSTLADAFTWLLFGKDSSNRSKFGIKTILNGETLVGLEHIVEATIEIKGKIVELKRVYHEKWTKTRGQTNEKLTGHETEYYIDEVPQREKDWQKYFEDIIPEKIFRLLTDPLYFNNVLSNDERRDIMVAVCGEVENNDIFDLKAMEKYQNIRELLDDKTADDALKMFASKRKDANKGIEEIPVRISEITDTLPEHHESIDFAEHEERKTRLELELKKLEAERENVLQKIENEEKEQYLRIGSKCDEIRDINSEKSKNEMEIRKITEKNKSLNELILFKTSKHNGNVLTCAEMTKNIEVIEDILAKLREEFEVVSKIKFEMNDTDTTCKACGQELPEGLKNTKIESMRQKFEVEREYQLEQIQKNGKYKNGVIQGYLGSIEKYSEQNIINLSEIENIKSEIKDVPGIVSDMLQTNKIETLEEEIKTIKEALKKNNKDDVIAGLKLHIIAKTGELKEVEKTINLKEVYEKASARIEELKESERVLSKVILDHEHKIFGVERYIQLKAETMESKLNKMFENVSFRLFETQINGGIKPTFETLVKGIPFSDANGAGRINAGIEIINKLSEVHDIQVPIFIDNAESVIELQKTESQVIELIVSAQDKELRVETC